MKKTYNQLRRAPERPVINCSGEEDLARQEFARDADINVMVERMMRGQLIMPQPGRYGAVDYTADLDAQYAAVQELRGQHHELTAKGLQLDFMTYLEKLNQGEPIELPQDSDSERPRAEPGTQTAPPDGGTEQTPKASA